MRNGVGEIREDFTKRSGILNWSQQSEVSVAAQQVFMKYVGA